MGRPRHFELRLKKMPAQDLDDALSSSVIVQRQRHKVNNTLCVNKHVLLIFYVIKIHIN